MFLGIDCGTQGTKALLVNARGVALGRGHAQHRLIESNFGAREQEPQWWVDALVASVRQALPPDTRFPMKAIGISGQQHGLVILDEAKQVIRPAKLWNDTETAAQNDALLAIFGGKAGWLERFGIVPLTGYTVSKLLWMKEREPSNFARIRHILLPHEYLNFWLTGELCAECGDASGTGYFNVRSLSWIPEVLAAIDEGTGQLLSALPRLIGSKDVVGEVRQEAADQLGIAPGCVVSSGGGDNMMGAVGTGNVLPGVVTLSLGTSATVYSFRQEPSEDRSGCVAAFCSSSGGWLPLVCTMNATNVVTQTVQMFGKTVAGIEPAMASTPPGADGLLFVPFLNGERTPDLPQARGSLAGISSQNFTPAHMIRAVVEGVSFSILEGLDAILHGASIERINVVGGGAKSAEWRQLLADASGAHVMVPAESEAGCLGACIQAMYACSALTAAPEPIEDIVRRCVRFDGDRAAHPRAELRVAYAAARAAYRAAVDTLYFDAQRHDALPTAS